MHYCGYMLISGAYAAVLTPRKHDDELDETRLRNWLLFLVGQGIRGFAINGATGELCRTTDAEFDRLMAIAAEACDGKAEFLASVGAATSGRAIALAKVARRRGATALLIPMPFFFPYSQGDIAEFCRTVAAGVDLPSLLYNLPEFTTPLEPRTSLQLIRECESIVGIKDSSGSLDTLRLLTAEGVNACRIVGSDGVFCAALEAGLCDAVVSGTGCVFPELIVKLFAMGQNGHKAEFHALERELGSVLGELDKLPVPWGLKMLAESRGLAPATFAFPLSPEREKQKAELDAWYRAHASALIGEPATLHAAPAR